MVNSHTRLVQSGSWAHTASIHFMGIGTGALNTAAVAFEPRTKVIQRTAGTFTKLQVNCTARTGSTVVNTRKSTVYATASVAGNLTVTIAATGITEDTTHNDVVTAADMWNYNFSALATTLSLVAVTFAATTNTASRLIAYSSGPGGAGVAFNIGSDTYPNTIAGLLVANGNGAEANTQTRIRQTGTLTNLFINIVTNNGAHGFTLTSRVAAGVGNLTTGLVATGTLGFVEDTTHTDNRVAGDDVDYLITMDVATVGLASCALGCDFTSTNGDSAIITGSGTNLAVALSTTTFMGLGGGLTTTTTETDIQTTVRDAFTTSNLSSLSTANTVSATSTISLRKGASSTGMNQTISFASNTPSLQSDTTHTDVFVATDLVDYQTVTGGTGTSLTLAFIEIWTNIGGAAAAVANPRFFTTKTDLRQLNPAFSNAPVLMST